jgi:hypothetical protein
LGGVSVMKKNFLSQTIPQIAGIAPD